MSASLSVCGMLMEPMNPLIQNNKIAMMCSTLNVFALLNTIPSVLQIRPPTYTTYVCGQNRRISVVKQVICIILITSFRAIKGRTGLCMWS